MKTVWVIVGTMFFISCSSLMKDPQVNITHVDVADISSQDITLNLNINIINPNGIPISLKKVNYALNMSGKKVTEGIFDQAVKIPANGQSDVVVPVKFKFNSFGDLVAGFLNKSASKEYELTGTADLGIISVPFTKKGEIDIHKK